MTIERSSQLRSRSGRRARSGRASRYGAWCARGATTPSGRMSCSTSRPGPRLTTRSDAGEVDGVERGVRADLRPREPDLASVRAPGQAFEAGPVAGEDGALPGRVDGHDLAAVVAGHGVGEEGDAVPRGREAERVELRGGAVDLVPGRQLHAVFGPAADDGDARAVRRSRPRPRFLRRSRAARRPWPAPGRGRRRCRAGAGPRARPSSASSSTSVRSGRSSARGTVSPGRVT